MIACAVGGSVGFQDPRWNWLNRRAKRAKVATSLELARARRLLSSAPMMKRLLLTALGIALVAAIAPHRDAHAQAAGTNPAGNCWERGKGTSSFDRNEYRITNSGTTKRPLLCPVAVRSYPVSVERDCGSVLCSIVQPFLPSRVYVTVEILDQNTATDMTCSLMARNETGSAVETSTRSTYGTGLQTLELEVAARADRAYLLRCDMPPNTSAGSFRFYTYRVSQWKP